MPVWAAAELQALDLPPVRAPISSLPTPGVPCDLPAWPPSLPTLCSVAAHARARYPPPCGARGPQVVLAEVDVPSESALRRHTTLNWTCRSPRLSSLAAITDCWWWMAAGGYSSSQSRTWYRRWTPTSPKLSGVRRPTHRVEVPGLPGGAGGRLECPPSHLQILATPPLIHRPICG